MPKSKTLNRYFYKKVLDSTDESMLLINASGHRKQILPYVDGKHELPVKNSTNNFLSSDTDQLPSTSIANIYAPSTDEDVNMYAPSTDEDVNCFNSSDESNTELEDSLVTNEKLSIDSFGVSNAIVPIGMKSKLSNWAIESNICQSSLKKLLQVLKSGSDISEFNNLPNDPRTLLNTPHKIVVREINPGLFYYFGIAETIKKVLKQYKYTILDNVNVIEVAANVDGLPISNSSSNCLWPILIQLKLHDLNKVVSIVALYFGNEKPKFANEYLRDFVSEAIELSQNGFFIENKKYGFKIQMLVCDTPAKSYCLSIKGHMGYHSCTKCTSEGNLVENVLCFPETDNLQQRTDQSFRQQLDEDYHNGVSILTELPNFDLVDDVVLDYMHLICLGVMKRMLTHKKFGWVFGKPPFKLPYFKIQNVSEHLSMIREFIPLEFGRKTRSLQECKRYKATELKLLLLYVGPIIFKRILDPAIYNHFLTLSVAITVLCKDEFLIIPNMINYANELLKRFVKTAINLYSVDFVSHNVHNLLHLANYVLRFGNLNNFSAFDFENHMQFIKHMLRTGHKPLQQIIHRVFEGRFCKIPDIINKKTSVAQEHFEGPLLPGCLSSQYKVLRTEYFTLKLNSADCYVYLVNNSVFRVHNISYFNNDIVVIGREFEDKKPFFNIPCDSSSLGIFLVNTSKLSNLKMYRISKIKCKLFYIPFETDKAVTYPILHTSNS